MSNAKGHDDQVDLWPDGEGPVRLMPEPEDEGQPLVVDLDGFAGPLDLLLQLAQRHGAKDERQRRHEDRAQTPTYG